MEQPTIKITQLMINSCQSAKDIADLPAVADNWIRTYNRCHGRNDGALRYEREKILFIQAISSNDWLNASNRFTQYVALMRMAVAGVSLDDQESSLIRRGNVCTLHIQWRGRRSQIQNLPQVIHIDEPVVVYDCDCDYAYTAEPYKPTRSMSGLIINDWAAATNRPKTAQIQHVYIVVTFRYGMKAYDMDRDDVLTIRDEYSDSYKEWINLMKLKAAAAAAGNPWPEGKVWKTKKDGSGSWYDEKPPMWVTREAEAWKKTMIHRLWKSMSEDKPAHLRYLDEEIAKEAHSQGVTTDSFGDDPGDYYEFGADFQLQPGAPAGARKPRKTAAQNMPPTEPAQQQAPPYSIPPIIENPTLPPSAPAVTAPTEGLLPPAPIYNTATGKWELPDTAPAMPQAEQPAPAVPDADLGDLDKPF